MNTNATIATTTAMPLSKSDPLLPTQLPKTANEAAATAFPEIAKLTPAFNEEETGNLNECPYLELTGLNEEFWAMTLGYLGTPEQPTVYMPKENQFRRYHSKTGIYEPVQIPTLIGALGRNLDLVASLFPPRLRMNTFWALKTRQQLESILETAKDLLAVNNEYFENHEPCHLAVTNGVINLSTGEIKPHSPNHPLTQTLPIKYDPNAKCDLFLESFLKHVLSPEDIDLLQRYCSQLLEGINHSQTILVLTGDSGWGKSSLMKILGSILGWNRVGIIRDQLFKNEFELAHYAGKHLLYHPDMPTDFLDRRDASLFKQLVGGDPIWAETKDDARMVLEGHFPIILACNGRPRIQLDQDIDAWTRRLVVLSFKTPSHEKHMGKLGEMLLKQESAGILNWLIQGRQKLLKDKFQLKQTQEQKERAAILLLGSESPKSFVRSCLVKQAGNQITKAKLYEEYQNWCKHRGIRAFLSKQFHAVANEEIEAGLGLRLRHDVLGENGKAKKGWKGLGLVKIADSENLEK